MIIGIGTDITKIDRMTEKIAKKILSEKEFEIFNSFSSDLRKMEFAAGRFAAKESLIKCLKNYYNFSDISILTNENGDPYIEEYSLNGIKKYLNSENINIMLTISHESEYAVAFALIEKI